MNNDSALLLGVNIDHVATLREARGTRYPDPVQAAMEVEQAGADSITIHLREDRRHIQQRDVILIKEVLLTRMNLEMAVTDEMLHFAEEMKPQDCCLVPERREELTTEGGLDVHGQLTSIKQACQRLSDAGIRVSPFIDADKKQIDAVLACKAPCIEIHTGHFADAKSAMEKEQLLGMIIENIHYAHSEGLRVHAGHGLNYQNVQVIASIKEVRELNIGHAIIARALFSGLQVAVSEMKRLMDNARKVIN